MALPFSQKTEKSEQRKAARTEYELKLKKDQRQAFISKTLTEGIKQAFRSVASQESLGNTNYQAIVRLDLWIKNSAFLLNDYRGLSRTDLDNAIGVDVTYLLSELDKLIERNKGWIITVENSHRSSHLPNQILVQRKN